MPFDKSKLFAPRPVTHSAEIDGQTMWFRVVAAGDRVALADIRATEGEVLTGEQQLQIALRLVMVSACDEQGDLLFGPQDEAALRALPGTLLDAMSAEAMRVNKIGRFAEDAAKN